MLTTCHGSCHCQSVRYRAHINFDQGTTRCNCSWCLKTRNWSAYVAPDDFELLAGKEALADYRQRADGIHNRFCRHCGTHLYYHGNIAEMGGAFLAVRVNTLDDIDNDTLFTAPVTYCDGRHDNWWQAPEDLRAL